MLNARTAMVAIHGVGAAEPGLIVSQLSASLEAEGAICEYTSAILNGERYATVRAGKADVPTLFEVNWSDVRRPTKSWLAQLPYWLQLGIAMLSIAQHWTGSRSQSSRTVAIYRAVVESLILWLAPVGVVLMLFASHAATDADQWKRVFIWLVSTTLAGIAAVGLRRRRFTLFGGGVVMTVFFAFCGGYIVWNPSSSYVFTTAFAKCQGLSYILLILLMFAVLIPVLLDRNSTWTQRLARLATAYVPALGVGVAGSVIWLLAIVLASSGTTFEHWQCTYLKGLQYNLKHLEIAMSAELGLLFLMMFVGIGIYFVASGKPFFLASMLKNWCFIYRAGQFAQDWLLLILLLMPFILLIVPFVALYDRLEFTWLWQGNAGNSPHSSVIEIYLASATRIIPMLPFVLTDLVVISDMLSDIAFYADPEQSMPPSQRIGSRENGMRAVTHERLSAILTTLLANGCERIVVAAHSQGSMIAAEVVAAMQDPRIYLVTFGSPNSSLYRRFLGWIEPAVKPTRWTNLFRTGDYIGGRVEGATNKPLGPGRHIGYWSQNEISTWIINALHSVPASDSD